MSEQRILPVHPGEYLKELLDELSITQYQLAKNLGISPMRVSHVVKGNRPITAELALRLGRYFGQDPRYWLNLQSRYDIDCAEDKFSEQVKREVSPFEKAL
jgi:antitoxin HigA-1